MSIVDKNGKPVHVAERIKAGGARALRIVVEKDGFGELRTGNKTVELGEGEWILMPMHVWRETVHRRLEEEATEAPGRKDN